MRRTMSTVGRDRAGRLPAGVLLLGALLLVSLLAGCGDDDGPGVPRDDTPPRVLDVEPDDGAVDVSPGQVVTVTFDEAMDTASAQGQVTLDAGTVTDLSWNADRTVLSIHHTDFPVGTRVTVTLGTGLADAAGNTLADPYTFSFWTHTETFTVLASDPEDGAAGVPLNPRVQLLFSRPPAVASLAGGITATVPDKGPVALTDFTVDGPWAWFRFAEDLPATTPVTVTVSTAVLAESDGAPLAAPFTFTFTTGSTADTTPPELVSVDPPSGATLPASGATLTLTFSEAVDREDLEPSAMNLQAVYYLGEVDGSWSADGTVWTIPLPDLPPGLPIHVVFDHLTDLAGNVNPEDIVWDAVVEGTPAYVAVLRETDMGYYGRWADEGHPTPQWNLEWSRWVPDDTGDPADLRNLDLGEDPTLPPSGWDYFTLTATRLQMRGTRDEDGDAWFSPVVDYMHLPPVPESWSGTTTVTADGGTGTVHYQVEVRPGTEDVDLGGLRLAPGATGPSSAKDVATYFWSDCRVAILSYTMESEGQTVAAGTDTLWLAPAIGLVQRAGYEEDPVGGSWYWENRVLTSIEGWD